MAVIKKYNSKRNPDGNEVAYQQSVSVSGAAISDEVVLPAGGTTGWSFTTTGSGTIEVSFSTVEAIDAGNGTYFDADIVGGATLSADTIGTMVTVSAVRINNVSGDTTLELTTKAV